MINVIATMHFQVDSKATAALLAQALGKTNMVAAQATVTASSDPDARVLLGHADLTTHNGEFIPYA